MPLKRYQVTERVGRSDIETIMKLTEEEATRLGLKESAPKGGRKQAKTPANKAARKPSNKQAKTPAVQVEDASDPSASE